MALNILFMGTTKFSAKVLENLYSSKHRVICVYSQPPSKKKGDKKFFLHLYKLKQKIIKSK